MQLLLIQTRLLKATAKLRLSIPAQTVTSKSQLKEQNAWLGLALLDRLALVERITARLVKFLKALASGAVAWEDASAVASTILENLRAIASDYTLTTNYNGISAGPVTVNASVTVTIPANATWVVL